MINCDNTPKISVIMPVYNADSFLEESILSIINQTYKNFELIIICSKPTKYTSNLLATFKKKDTRIIIHYQEKKGIISARNFGCKIARGEYIAIMDADDISEPERLAIQIEFLEKNPAFSVVGSWVDIIDDKGRCIKKERPPTQPDVIGWHLFLGNCIMHSSVLIRTDLLKKLHYYSGSDIGFPEDYNLWMKVFFCTKLAIISKPLVKYRMHNKNTSFDSIWMKKNEFYKNIIRNDMVKKFIPDYYNVFIQTTRIREDKWVFAFDPHINNYQIELFKILYLKYIEKYSPSSRDIASIKMYIWAHFLIYSLSMFHHSKSMSFKIFLKSIHYLSIMGIINNISNIPEFTRIYKISNRWSQ